MISPEAVPIPGVLVGGPGIRYSQIARSLKEDYGHDVSLAVPVDHFVDTAVGPVRMVGWDLDNVLEIVSEYDCVVMTLAHSGLSTAYRTDADPKIPTAVDLYDPVLIENIGLQPADAEGARSFSSYLSGVVPILKRGDYFFCANERQRLYYLGVLNALGRVNPLTYKEKLLEIVPFGVDDKPAKKTEDVMRGSLIDADDKIILWFSGIYPWFDALTLIEAMPTVLEGEPRAKLVILGGVHPHGHAPDGEYKRTIERADELGLLSRSVLLVDWQPYETRANWYLESDIAVVTHKPSLETELSHRTRVIDFMWAGLPTITSQGDTVGEMLENRGCGLTVPTGDKDALASAILSLLRDDTKREKMSDIARTLAAAELTWKKVLEPLAAFCADPKLAADRLDSRLAAQTLSAIDTFEEHDRLLNFFNKSKSLWNKAQNVYKTEGLGAAINRSIETIGRQMKNSDSDEDRS